MIYFDNAATSFPKPKEVEEAMVSAIRTLGNASRGAHAGALTSDRVIFHTRQQLRDLFHAESSSDIAFSQNDTQALNTALFGLLSPGDHVITTACEHNSVLRPLYRLEKAGVELTILPADPDGTVDPELFEYAVQWNTKLIVMTHASNLTGNVMPLTAAAECAEKHHLLLVLDAAQTAGLLPIDVRAQGIDVLTFSGHKGLLGPQGTGGLVVREGVEIRPLMTGGTGVQSFLKEQPQQMPTRLEAGTQNGHGIAGLSGGLTYLSKVGTDAVYEKALGLSRYFYEGVVRIPNVKVYGSFPEGDWTGRRVPTIALNIGDMNSSDVADLLWTERHIAVRAGAHCAPLMHEALGTAKSGAVRFSFSHYNTKEEVDTAIEEIQSIAC